MKRDSVALAILVSLCFAATAFNGAPCKGTGFRQPDVPDWRVFHRNNDEYWANMVTATTGWWDPSTKSSKIRLTASEVRRMRLFAGITDDDPSDSILQVVGHGMKVDQYLFVAERPNGCLSLAVYGAGWHLKQLWSTDKLPNGSDICRQPACPEPRVWVGEGHEINVMTFARSTPTKAICDLYSSASYALKGKSFELKDQGSGVSMCRAFDAYGMGLNIAFRRAAGPGEILAIVENSALSPEWYALVLQRQASVIRVLRMGWQREARSEAPEVSRNDATTWDCYSRGASVHVTVTALEIPQNKAQYLATALEQADLRSDRCARRADRECAMILDGRRFTVQVGDNPSIRLTDVKGLRGYVSENLELSAWVYRLLDETKDARRTSTD